MQSFDLSIVLPCYNGGDVLRNTLNHYRELNLDRMELILIDDGSQDDTRNIIKEFETKLPLRSKFFNNHGQSFATNRGIEMARSPVVLLSCQDIRPTQIALKQILPGEQQMDGFYYCRLLKSFN